jgi:hypothetical protein
MRPQRGERKQKEECRTHFFLASQELSHLALRIRAKAATSVILISSRLFQRRPNPIHEVLAKISSSLNPRL